MFWSWQHTSARWQLVCAHVRACMCACICVCVRVHVCAFSVLFVIYLDCAGAASSLFVMSDVIIHCVPIPSLSFASTTAGADVYHRGRVDAAPLAVILLVPTVHSLLQPITGSFTVI